MSEKQLLLVTTDNLSSDELSVNSAIVNIMEGITTLRRICTKHGITQHSQRLSIMRGLITSINKDLLRRDFNESS